MAATSNEASVEVERDATVLDLILFWLQQLGVDLPAQIVTAWLAESRAFSKEEDLRSFLQGRDSLHLRLCLDGGDWVAGVGEKGLKLIASEYATLRDPKADTGQVTAVVRVLIGENTLYPITKDRLERVCSSLSIATQPRWPRALLIVSVVALVIYKDIVAASRLVLPVFHEVMMTRGDYTTDLPTLLAFFNPMMSFGNLNQEERVRLLFHCLQDRGFCVKLRSLAERPSSSGGTVQTTASSQRDITFDNVCNEPKAYRLLEVTVTAVADGATEETLELTPQQLFARVIKEAKRYCEKQKEETRRRRMVKAKIASGQQEVNVAMIMNDLHRLLRLQSPFDKRTADDGMLPHILRSDGWIPLSYIQLCIQSHLKTRAFVLPEDKNDIVVEILLSHDSYRRFEIGTCELKTSEFYQQQCVRSIYGHAVRDPKLYRNIICHRPQIGLDSAEMVPLYGWVAVEAKTLKVKINAVGLRLFDNIPFVVVMPADALGVFKRYKECTPPTQQYDEKLKKKAPICFVEVYLRALVRDVEGFKVYITPFSPTEPDTRRWYVFPQYTLTSETNTQLCKDEEQQGRHKRGKLIVLPKLFFTGRSAVLGAESDIRENVGWNVVGDRDHHPPVDGARRSEEGDDSVAAGTKEEVSRRSTASLSVSDQTAEPDSAETWGELHQRRGTSLEFEPSTALLSSSTGEGVGNEDSDCAEGGERHHHQQQQLRQPQEMQKHQRCAIATWWLPVEVLQKDATVEYTVRHLDSTFYSEVFSDASVLHTIFADYPDLLRSGDDGNEEEKGSGSGDARAATVWGMQSLRPAHQVVELDVSSLVAEVETFVADPDRTILLLRVPLYDDAGYSLTNRRKYLDKLRVKLAASGLSWAQVRYALDEDDKGEEGLKEKAETTAHDGGEEEEEGERKSGEAARHAPPQDPSPAAGGSGAPLATPESPSKQVNEKARFEVFEIRKPYLFPETALDDLMRELGFSEQKDRAQQLRANLRASVTRECENRNNNYEMLEFIGDALMDFITKLDTFLLHTCVGNGAVKQVGCGVPMLLKARPEVYLCCNRVLAMALPTTVESHLKSVYREVLHFKVKADVFEALLGAVYRSHYGIDQVRRVMRVLFSRLPSVYTEVSDLANKAVITGCASSQVGMTTMCEDMAAESRGLLKAAIETCPYLYDSIVPLEQLYQYRCLQIVDAPLLQRFIEDPDVASVAAPITNSQAASIPFPRVQDKDYATHFTTGPAYSYRRIASDDTPQMHNRILALHQAHTVAFTNEVLTPITHLVVDFDGANVRSWQVLGLLYRWYETRFHCPAAVLLLDCTGVSVVKKALKESFHVHFPQITVRLEDFAALQEDMRQYITQTLSTTRATALIHLSNIPKQGLLFSTSFVKSRLRSLRAATPQRRRMWDYCTFDDLTTLLRVSCAVRRSVLEHVMSMHEDLHRLARLFDRFPSSPGDSSRQRTRVLLGKPEENAAVVVVQNADGVRWLLPAEWLQQSIGASKSWTVRPSYPEAATWDTVLDPGLVKSRKLRMYLCDKFDTVYGQEHRPLYLDAILLPGGGCRGESVSGAPTTSPTTRELLTERPDRSQQRPSRVASRQLHAEHLSTLAQHGRVQSERRTDGSLAVGRGEAVVDPVPHGQSRRVGFLGSAETHRSPACPSSLPLAPPQKEKEGETDALGDERTEAVTTKPYEEEETDTTTQIWTARDDGASSDEDAEGWDEYPVEMAHATTLRLTALRCPSFRDVTGQLYDAWAPTPIEGGPSAVSQVKDPELGTWAAQLRVALPSFHQLFSPNDCGGAEGSAGQLVRCPDWPVWVNCCQLPPVGFAMTEKSKPRASAPAWWAYDTSTRTATMYVAGEPVMRVPHCGSLTEALQPPSSMGLTAGFDGMRRMARLLVPHVDYSAVPFEPNWAEPYAGGNVLPLFVDLMKSKAAPVVQLAVKTKAAEAAVVPRVGLSGAASPIPPRQPLQLRQLYLPSVDDATTSADGAALDAWLQAVQRVVAHSAPFRVPLILFESEALRVRALRHGFDVFPHVWLLSSVSRRVAGVASASGPQKSKATVARPISFGDVFVLSECDGTNGVEGKGLKAVLEKCGAPSGCHVYFTSRALYTVLFRQQVL